MNLNTIAESDLSFILEDVDDGFGVAISVTNPLGIQHTLNGQSNDIGFLIDPSTGVNVIGRNCEIVFRLSTVLSTLGTIPNKTASNEGWIFAFSNTNNQIWNFGLLDCMVDRKLGVVKMILELLDVSSDS